MPIEPERIDVAERLREVWSRRKWLALSVFAFTAAGGVTLALSLPDVYRATATLLVQDSKADFSMAAELDRRLQMISQEILSRARLDGIIRRFGLYPELRQRPESAAYQMRRDIGTPQFQAWSGAGSVGGTLTVAISYHGTNPVTVAHVANALAGLYLEEDRAIRERQASGNVQMLEAQINELRQTMDTQEKEMGAFQESHKGELPSQSEATLAALEQFHAELRATSDERMRAMDRRNDLLRRLSELESEQASSSVTAPGGRASRLEKLKGELAELQRRFSDRYPDVIRVKAEIAALESDRPAAEASPAAAPAPPAAASGPVARLKESLSEVDRQIEAFRADESRLRSAIGGYIQRLESAPRRQRDLQEISRDYQTTRDLYDTLRKRYEQAQLDESTENRDAGPRFRILDPAVVPVAAAAPNRQLLLLFSLLAAIGAGVAAAVVAERLDTSFKSADDVRAFTDVPVLTSIPRITTVSEERSRRLRWLAASVCVLLAIGVVMKASHVVARDNEALVVMLSRGQS